jgi:hypothetical protein
MLLSFANLCELHLLGLMGATSCVDYDHRGIAVRLFPLSPPASAPPMLWSITKGATVRQLKR